MAVSAGTRLGPYEILEPLGAGGMGEVYRARDPRLDRQIAIKVLRSEVASDPDRLRRFEREARALAALKHPNILDVHDFGSEGGTVYIVSELLEGETLRNLLGRRQPGLREAIDYGIQVARGLAAAHEKDIVHRDIKPANLFVTRDGSVKVLDFGLAKVTRPEPSTDRDAATATAAGDTGPDTLLGTVDYMSPEQLRGLAIDHRSDIFSFGMVLYEMLARRHPFLRETAPATLAAIVNDTPPDLRSLERGIPPALGNLVQRCLEKRREDRFRGAHDLALALEALLQAPSGAAPLPEAGERGPYPGLNSFTEEEARHFFGREEEVKALWEKLRSRSLLALIGPSGAGKTSFLRAGVIPARPEGWAAIVCVPGQAPVRALARALAPGLAGDPEALARLPDFEDLDVAVSLLTGWRRAHGEALVVVDQLEELFTQSPPEEQARFAGLLGRLAQEADVRVLLSLRDDFLMRCHAHAPLARVFSELTPLDTLAREGLRRAIEEPARKLGYAFENAALVDEMLDAVEGARGALPLLAFALSRLWEKRDQDRGLLTRGAYEEIGAVTGALVQHAEQTWERLGPERQPIVREIFRNLVTAHGTRASSEREELLSVFPERERASVVLQELIAARLVTSYEVRVPMLHRERVDVDQSAEDLSDDQAGVSSAPGASHRRIEIVHESLLEAWPRLLWWQAQDEEGAQLRDHLKQAAHLWDEAGRSDDLLWTGAAERDFEVWRDRYPGQLTAVEGDFAGAMVRRARRWKRLRRLAVASVVVGLGVVTAAIAVSRHQEAAARRHAEVEALRAEAGKLLALARLEIDRYPTAALAYARASLDLADTSAARRFVVEVLWHGPVARILSPDRILGGGGQPENPTWSRPAFSPDARWLALKNESLQRLLLVPHDGGPPRTVQHPRGNVDALGFGPRSDVLFTGGSGARLRFLALPDLREIRRIEMGGVSSWGSFGGESLYTLTRMAEGDRHRVFRSWSVPGGESKTLGTVDWDSISGASIDPAGHLLAYASGRSVCLLPINDPRRNAARVLGRHPDTVYLVEFFPGGDGVASVDKAGEIRLWPLSPSASAPLRILQGPKSSDWLLAVDRGATHLARSGVAGSLHLWDLRDAPDAEPAVLKRTDMMYGTFGGFDPSGRWLVVSNAFNVAFWPVTGDWRRVLPGYSSGTWRLAFTPDGRWLASCTLGEAARLWPTSPARGEARALGPEGCWGMATHPASTHVLVTTYPDGFVFLQRIAGGPPVPLRTGWEGKAGSYAVAFDAPGRRVAACSNAPAGSGTRVLRVWDLETGEGRSFSLAPSAGWCDNVAFAPDGALFIGGDGGVLRVDLPEDPDGPVSAETLYAAGRASFALHPDGQQLLVWAGRNPGAGFEELLLFDSATHTSRRITTHGQRPYTAAFDPSGRIVVSADSDGVVRAGPVSGEEPHLLLGHRTMLTALTVSPDGRWIASVSDDGLSLWPMPDVTRPPLHTLPHAELMAKLDALTNLHLVRDPSSSTGWKQDVGPFPGWRDVPTWQWPAVAPVQR